MDDYLSLPGPLALSDFRLEALARDLKAKRIIARHVHYVAFHQGEQFRDEEQRTLDHLLEYGEPFPEDLELSEDERRTTFYVTPRVGTISPWVGVSS